MGQLYSQLLEATIQHLEGLRDHGVRFLPVAADTLASLGAPVPRPSPRAAQPAPTRLAAPAAPERRPDRGPAAGSTVSASPPPGKDNDRPAGSPAPPPGAPPRQSLTREGKEAAMAALRARALACRKCAHLAATRTNVVFGVGDIHAPLMFVGEAPGADEDAQGEPFVGAAGRLLTRIIQTMGLARSEVYIANILKCRPDTPGQTSGNRKPTPSEMVTCLPFLVEQIELIQPKVVVALGATAVAGLLGDVGGIGRLRGQWHAFHGTPLMPTFHPSYLLHNPALGEKRKVWEDMLKVMEKLGLPISDKQRGFFLKGSANP